MIANWDNTKHNMKLNLRKSCVSLSLLFWLTALPAWAQSNAATRQLLGSNSITPLPAPALTLPDNIQPDLVAPAAPDSYIIGSNDLLTVFVYQMPELTRQLRVGQHGHIRLPFVRQEFLASGKTAPSLQRAIARTLVADGLARRPMVQVVVRQVESKPIVITGAVYRPQTLQAARPMRLLEVISRAGGLTSQAGNTILVVRRQTSGSASIHRYDLTQLVRYDNPRDNPLLMGNDSVTVMPAQFIYVVGSVQRPGAFPLMMGEPITVIKAVALARGLTNSPDKSNTVLIQTLPDGRQKITHLRLDRILHHKAPDVTVNAGDILYVPHNGAHVILVDALQDAAQAAVIAFGYSVGNGKL